MPSFRTLLALGGVTALMLLFTSLTPLAYDDYSYFLSAPNMMDILPASYKMYMEWNGRFIATVIAHTLLLLPTGAYCALTAIAFVALLLCLLINVYGKDWLKAVGPVHVVLAFALMWSSVPGFGAAFFWRVGTAYYLWTSLAVFAAFVPFRLLLSRTDHAALSNGRCALLCLLCFCAGLSIENMGILPLMFALAVFFYKKHSKTTYSRKYYLAAGCILAGFLCLFLAPGNYVRLQGDSKNLPLAVQTDVVAKFLYWVEKMLMAHGYMLIALVLCAALALFLYKRVLHASAQQKEWSLLALVFFVFGLMSSASFFFSPGFPLRAFTGISLLYIQAALCLFAVVQPVLPRPRLWATLVVLALTVSLGYEIRVFYVNHAINQERLRIFATSKGQDVIVPPYPHADKFFFVSSQIKDLQNGNIVNGLIARYYGLGSVKTP